MPKINVSGTLFTLNILPPNLFGKGFWAKTEIAIENEYVSYRKINKRFTRDELEHWIFTICRFLAGAYARSYTLNFETVGLTAVFVPYEAEGGEATREELRRNDCVMVLRFPMLTNEDKTLGGAFSILLHREELKEFVNGLRAEFDAAYEKFEPKKGKYCYVGISPLGYEGCNYWYLDKTNSVKKGDFVWVRMGRHDTLQIAFVDRVRYFDDETVPYDPERLKQVLKKATPKELAEIGIK
jgi:hypothetical protein